MRARCERQIDVERQAEALDATLTHRSSVALEAVIALVRFSERALQRCFARVTLAGATRRHRAPRGATRRPEATP